MSSSHRRDNVKSKVANGLFPDLACLLTSFPARLLIRKHNPPGKAQETNILLSHWPPRFVTGADLTLQRYFFFIYFHHHCLHC